jgi:hypothetical protein
MRTLYLNNTGHRWVNVDNKGRRERVLVWDGEKASTRAIDYFEAIGNFAVAFMRVKGKRVALRELGTVVDCG